MYSSTLFLIITFLSDDVIEAYNLIKDLEPSTPQEYILKGVVNAALGQDQGSVSGIDLSGVRSPMELGIVSSLYRGYYGYTHLRFQHQDFPSLSVFKFFSIDIVS